MRKLAVIIIVFIVDIGYGQDDDEFRLESVQLIYGVEYLHHGNQVFNHFSNTVSDQNVFDFGNPAYNGYSYERDWYENPSYNIELTVRKNNSKWRYNFGAIYSRRNERRYSFVNTEEYIIDTVYAPAPYVYYDGSTEEYWYTVDYDTLLLDSAVNHQMNINSSTRNIVVYGEFLRDFKKNKWTISTGVRLGIGMSLTNDVVTNSLASNGLWMVRPEEFNYGIALWYADMPTFQPIQGSLVYGPYSLTEVEHRHSRGNGKFYLRPSVPVRFDAQIAKNGFFSHICMVGSISAGMEFQIIKNDGINSRFFWNYRFGLKYRI